MRTGGAAAARAAAGRVLELVQGWLAGGAGWLAAGGGDRAGRWRPGRGGRGGPGRGGGVGSGAVGAVGEPGPAGAGRPARPGRGGPATRTQVAGGLAGVLGPASRSSRSAAGPAYGRRLARPVGGLVRAGAAAAVAAGCRPSAGTLDALALVPCPEAAAPLGPGQVRVAVRAAGLNFRDVLIAPGHVPRSAG